MGFSRQEYWRGLPFPSDLPYPGIQPGSPTLQADSSPSELPGQLGQYIYILECQRAHFPSANDLMHKLLHGPKCWLFQHFMKVASIWTLLNWLFVQVELNLLKSKSVLQLESPVWLSKSEFWGIAKFPGNLSGAFSRWLVADVYFSKWNKFTNYISNQILQPS